MKEGACLTIQLFLIITSIQIVFVACSTFRVILMIKGHKYFAAWISMIETIIYIVGLDLVLRYTDQILGVVAYAFGYAIGLLLGSWIEEKVALGFIILHVQTGDAAAQVDSQLRQQGYGVTAWVGAGQSGPDMVIEVLARRKQQKALQSLISRLDPSASITVLGVQQWKGGYIPKR